MADLIPVVSITFQNKCHIDFLQEFIHVCLSGMVNIAYKRILETSNKSLSNEHFNILLRNHMDIATLNWCDLFGSDKGNLHYKQIKKIEESQFNTHFFNSKEDVKSFLLNPDIVVLHMAIYKLTTAYRDKKVAHHDIRDEKNQPFSSLLEVLLEYFLDLYNKLIEIFKLINTKQKEENICYKYRTHINLFDANPIFTKLHLYNRANKCLTPPFKSLCDEELTEMARKTCDYQLMMIPNMQMNQL